MGNSINYFILYNRTMNNRSLAILEYNKIINMLISHAGSVMGKEKCKNLKPLTDINEIIALQNQTSDALNRVFKYGNLSFQGIANVGPCLKRLEVDAALSSGELLSIGKLLDVASGVKQYGNIQEHNLPINDSLSSFFMELMPLESLNREIKRCILSEDEIADDASSTLKSIRRSIKLTNDKIHSQLLSIVNSQSNRTLLQDSIITMRNGRYCIPVKQEYKSSFPGMIHDQSSSGSTAFIEPMAVVNLNNELKELGSKEILEIEKILISLSQQVGYEIENIKDDLSILVELDFIFARAALARDYNGTEPLFNDNGILDIKKGRHPLLDKHTVVPIDIKLGEDFSMLVITGPNTGGKTVALKTAGLFTLMGQSGLHIPASANSSLCVFEDVFADIGDEQSIEQSLSTFSSHMTNIVSIVNKASKNTLCLFDELGGGTDPIEGAALAISILSYLNSQEIRCIATTHYSELKVFALSTTGIENACCEFDVASLKPTYRLLIGIPGKSNAFAISKKLGLPDFIIENAKTQIDSSTIEFETLLADIEKSKLEIEKEKEEIEKYKNETQRLKNQILEKEKQLDKKKDKLIRDAKEEARTIIEEAKEVADDTIRKYNNWGKKGANANNKEMEAARGDLRNRLNSLNKDLSYSPAKKQGTHKASEFKIGDAVHVLTLSLDGTVSSLPNAKGDLFVQMGILRSLVNIKDLEIIDEPVITGPNIKCTSKGNVQIGNKAATISPSINLLGKTVDEAIALLDKYLDDAYISHMHQVTVIHGKGTGALRKAIHSYLGKQKNISEYRSGAYGEGEAGVTIVEFK